MLNLRRTLRWSLGCGGVLLLAIWVFSPGRGWSAPDSRRLAAGEIVTSTRNLPSGAKRGEAIGVVNAPPAKVWQTVTDANSYREFLPKMVSSRLVRFEELSSIIDAQPSEASQVEALFGSAPPGLAVFRIPGRKYLGYFYGQVEVPWPFKDRWYIVRVDWDETRAARGVYTCSWSLMIGNLAEYRGQWQVEPFGRNRTRLTYRVVVDPGGFIPKSVADEFTRETLPQVIAGVRRRVAHRKIP